MNQSRYTKRVNIGLTPALAAAVNKAQADYRASKGATITLQAIAEMGITKITAEIIREKQRKESGK